jgi:IS30 family transposase
VELGRRPSTLYREIKRNRHLDEEPLFRGYFPTVAQTNAMGRRVRGAKVARNPELATYIVDRLEAAWSPEQIAGYVRRHRLAGLSESHAVFIFHWPTRLRRDPLKSAAGTALIIGKATWWLSGRNLAKRTWRR